MRRSTLFLATAGAAALALAPTAGAVNSEPGTFATASQGSLQVISSALVDPKTATMQGGWLNEAIPCTEFRRLVVRMRIDYVSPGGAARAIIREKTGVRQNCAEGGPNLGFFVKAAPNRLACPNGRWKPGDYTFTTRTTHKASRLRATGSVFYVRTGSC